MKIVLVSDFNEIPQEILLLNALFEQGLEYFHLRKRDYSLEKICNYLDHISPVFYERIVIHSHFNLVERYGLRGVHFKKNYTLNDFLQDMTITASEARARYRHLSHSVHSLNEIKNNSFAFNYLFLSPVFDSISNKGYNSKIKIQAIRKFFKEEPNRPEVIALSGITADKVVHIAESGFNGLGLLGYIWVRYKEDGNVAAAVQRFQLVQQKVKELNVGATER
jgi:thiamine-phosphate pyrophosphorylase